MTSAGPSALAMADDLCYEDSGMKALLVANPKAGRVRGEAGIARIEQRLCAAGMEVVTLAPSKPEKMADALRAELAGESPERVRVVVAGGDGTINSALPALAGTGVPLAVLPVGSVNVLARELGLPIELEAAVQVASQGRPRRIDLGMANGKPFALMAGMGFDAEVVGSVAQDIKNVVGSFAYVGRGLHLLGTYPASRFHIEADGEEFETDAWLAVVANANRYTYRWRLEPEAMVDDGWLDLCLFSSSSLAGTAGQVIAALSGRHSTHPGVRHMRAKSFIFDCNPPVAFQLDGDPAGQTPVQVHVASEALTVMVPAED